MCNYIHRQRRAQRLHMYMANTLSINQRCHASIYIMMIILCILVCTVRNEQVSAFGPRAHSQYGTLLRFDVSQMPLQITCRSSKRIRLSEGLDSNSDDDQTQLSSPQPRQQQQQYVQQEQLLEMVSRIGATTIASLSVSERTKRAMLAEAIEDEIFSCTEQIIDRVQEIQQEQQQRSSNVSGTTNDNVIIKKLNDQIIELKERNQYLQLQYNDLVSGRSSSLLNTVNSVGIPVSNEEMATEDDNDIASNSSSNNFD